MGAKKKVHQLVAIRKANTAVVNYQRKQFYLGPWDVENDCPSPQAQQRLTDLIALWKTDPTANTAAPKPEFKLLIELWADWRDSPECQQSDNVDRAERYLFGDGKQPGPHRATRASEFRGAELRGFQRYLCDMRNPKTKERILARGTVLTCVRAIRKCFAWGLIGGHIKYDQYRELELVEPPSKGQVRENGKRHAVQWETVEPVLSLLSNQLASMLRLLWYTGARPSELKSMKCGHIQRTGTIQAASGVLLDLDTLGVWAAVLREHKTDGGDYDRVIFFGPKSQAILQGLIDHQSPEVAVFRPKDATAENIALARSRRTPTGKGMIGYVRKGDAAIKKPGDHYHPETLAKVIKMVCQRHKLKLFTPYQVRHAVGVLVQQRWGREASRVFLGHHVGGVTERYAGSDLDRAAKVAAEWG
jgi:integrase